MILSLFQYKIIIHCWDHRLWVDYQRKIRLKQLWMLREDQAEYEIKKYDISYSALSYTLVFCEILGIIKW